MQPERQKARDRLLRAHGFDPGALRPLAADASFRSYDRVDGGAVLMNAPPGKEDIRPFCRIAHLLREWKLSAPRLIAEDPEAGFLLLEDFGDGLFSRHLREGHPEVDLYALAVDVLAHLAGRTPPDGLPAYDMELLLAETDLVLDWRFNEVRGRMPTDTERAAYRAAWTACLAPVAGAADTLVLRDYHVDNLMLLDRPGVQAAGLLDFQDAVRGHAAYDLASLLSDVRRDVPEEIEDAMLARYCAASGCDAAELRRAYTLLAAQRNAKILGIFTRLWRRDGKDAYLKLLPRTWALLRRDLGDPALAPVADWFAEHLSGDPAEAT